MEADLQHNKPGAKPEIRFDASIAAVNTKYAAFVTGDHVVIQPAGASGDTIWSFALPNSNTTVRINLEFSPVELTYLAISTVSEVWVYDVEAQSSKYVLRGGARAIVAISWSCHTGHVLATGGLDGSVYIWDFTTQSIPIHVFKPQCGPITKIAWCPQRADILAVSSDDALWIWSLQNAVKRIKVLAAKEDRLQHLLWHPHQPERLLTASRAGSIVTWNIREPTETSTQRLHDHHIDGGIFDFDPAGFDAPQAYQVTTLSDIVYLSWLGDRHALALCEYGRRISLLDLDSTSVNKATVWDVSLQSRMTGLVMIEKGESPCILAFNQHIQSEHRVPDIIANSTGLQYHQASSSSDIADSALKARLSPQTSNVVANRAMKPFNIGELKRNGYTPRKSLKRRTSSYRVHSGDPKDTCWPHGIQSNESVSTSQPLSEWTRNSHSSLEVPQPRTEKAQSPMPFLSPSIPARKPSPYTDAIPLLDEESSPVAAPETTFGSFSSTTIQDSDSDDETYGSRSIHEDPVQLPAGVNVPLPRSCGAIFARVGTLVTFFPPTSKTQAAKKETLSSEQTDADGHLPAGTAWLFPSFGNLAADIAGYTWLPDGTHANALKGKIPTVEPQVVDPATDVQLSLASWTTGSTFIGAPLRSASIRPTVNVSVRVLDSVVPSERYLAEQYRVVREGNETGAQLCEHNHTVAAGLGSADNLQLWHLLIMILEDVRPLNSIGSTQGQRGELELARRTFDARSDVTGPSGSNKHAPLNGKLRWSDHPLGSHWLLQQIFDWADARCELQMLAYMSAAVVEASASTDRSLPEATFLQGPTSTAEYFHRSKGVDRPRLSGLSIPTLRTEYGDSQALRESPRKLQTSSHASSHAGSQPTTPYIESSSTTPPWSFSQLTRSGSRLSAAGSASPEAHRGSLSSTAKSYAQSVTDKFALFGTSPPIRRGGILSGNELSSSLPSGSGSWSKSVSFASAAETGQDSLPGRNSMERDDGYDSDRTIEDSSLPLTPKESKADVTITWKNQNKFSDDASGQAEAPLLPPELRRRCSVWIQAHAEQLRCWGLYDKAAEFEKIASAMATSPSPLKDDSLRSVAMGSGPTACSICYCAVSGAQQLCPSCLHVSHLSCLEKLLASSPPDGFECPTGCGCACASLPYLPLVWTEDKQPAKTVVRRKRSLTDPRIWRARLEGDSW